MKRERIGFSQHYRAALRKHVENGRRAVSGTARNLGRRALDLGLATLDLARIHERALIVLAAGPPQTRNTIIRRSAAFFAEAIAPLEKNHRAARAVNRRLDRLNRSLRRRSADLAVSNRKLKQEIALRRVSERALKRSEQHYALLLANSRELQDQLRRLSRQLLSAQEEERKKISRELHDEIAQTLTGIHVRLASLNRESDVSAKTLQKRIASAQKMVERSVRIVHQFARELRPPALDDLGLIPALHALLKHFSAQTGIRVRLTVFAHIERMDVVRRTVMYRVVQEALTNINRHARANRADVSLREQRRSVCMTITDDGRGFLPEKMLAAKGNRHLGLLGMRERVEMVGGSFSFESAPGKGTTIRTVLPFRNGTAARRRPGVSA